MSLNRRKGMGPSAQAKGMTLDRSMDTLSMDR